MFLKDLVGPGVMFGALVILDSLGRGCTANPSNSEEPKEIESRLRDGYVARG